MGLNSHFIILSFPSLSPLPFLQQKNKKEEVALETNNARAGAYFPSSAPCVFLQNTSELSAQDFIFFVHNFIIW